MSWKMNIIEAFNVTGKGPVLYGEVEGKPKPTNKAIIKLANGEVVKVTIRGVERFSSPNNKSCGLIIDNDDIIKKIQFKDIIRSEERNDYQFE